MTDLIFHLSYLCFA